MSTAKTITDSAENEQNHAPSDSAVTLTYAQGIAYECALEDEFNIYVDQNLDGDLAELSESDFNAAIEKLAEEDCYEAYREQAEKRIAEEEESNKLEAQLNDREDWRCAA